MNCCEVVFLLTIPELGMIVCDRVWLGKLGRALAPNLLAQTAIFLLEKTNHD
jgi:hypothetical protein